MLIRVNVNAPDDKITEFGAGAKLYWARDNTSRVGAFTDASGSVTLVAAQSQYEIIDSTGVRGHFYRTRVGNVGGTSFDEWSDVFQVGAPTAYAELDDLREYIGLPDASQDNTLSDLLAQASDYIDVKCGRDFYRHPAVTGTETRTYDGTGGSIVWIPDGIVSATGASLRLYTGSSPIALASGDWVLGPADKLADRSYQWIGLSDVGAYRTWSVGYGTVSVTGVFGNETIPPLIAKATLDLAREWYRQGPGGGGPVGVNQFGTPMFLQGMPTTVREVIAHYGLVAVA